MYDSDIQNNCAEIAPSSSCSLQGGQCLVAKLAEVFNEIPGSRISMQRDRDEFTFQVTEPCGDTWIIAFRATSK